MNVSPADLDAAVQAGIIQPEDLARLAVFLQARSTATAPPGAKPRFDLSHVLWYAGALIVMSAAGDCWLFWRASAAAVAQSAARACAGVESASFFEKKEAKKLLLIWTQAVSTRLAQTNKSFLLLFFKKEVLA